MIHITFYWHSRRFYFYSVSALCVSSKRLLSFSVWASAEDNVYVYTRHEKTEIAIRESDGYGSLQNGILEECWKKGRKVWCCSVQCSHSYPDRRPADSYIFPREISLSISVYYCLQIDIYNGGCDEFRLHNVLLQLR